MKKKFFLNVVTYWRMSDAVIFIEYRRTHSQLRFIADISGLLTF